MATSIGEKTMSMKDFCQLDVTLDQPTSWQIVCVSNWAIIKPFEHDVGWMNASEQMVSSEFLMLITISQCTHFQF
jgi:hypothetical protein